MEKVYEYYEGTVTAYTRRVNDLRRKIHIAGTIRLILFLGAMTAVWFLKDSSWQTILGALILFAIPFAALMFYHNKLSGSKIYAEGLIRLCRNELKGLAYDFSAFDGAPDKINGEHSFSLDLDIFGDRSFFQSINRTITYTGREKLTEWFTKPLTNKQDILKRQEAVEELSNLTHLRQHFYVTGTLYPGEKGDINLVNNLMSSSSFFTNKIWGILSWLIPGLWVLFILLHIAGILPGFIFSVYFPISAILAFCKIGHVNKVHETVNKMEKVFLTYSQLLKSIEDDSFKSELLKETTVRLIINKRTSSQAIKQLSGYIKILDQRANMGGILLNIFTLREIRASRQIEKWKEKYSSHVPQWFEALAHFDALSSLAGFAFNHPQYIYPEITENYFSMEGKALGHPLLHRNLCITNDISINQHPSFLIITGANMAGKSTFLRTVGINFLLSCIGAPVYADKLAVYPASLVTSLRTSDSLVSNESYFFAELKRLKMIIERLEKGEELFIILDEILKGTNSIDKQKGSLALIKQFLTYQTHGIIATHDLVLGTLEEEFPDEVKNYRFEADITNNELSFSYLLREGVAQNMNACFLMNKMGITI